MSLANKLQVSELFPPSHLHLPSIPFQRLLEKSSAPTPEHLSNTTKVSQVSNTTGTPLDSIFVHRFEAWSQADPRPKHQALAPSLPMLLHSKFTFVRVWLTFNASARACGQKRCQTMSNMRTYKAICDIQPCPLPHIWNQQTAEAKIAKNMKKSRWTSAEKK